MTSNGIVTIAAMIFGSMKSHKTPLVSIADVQNFEDTRRIDINKVGIKGIRHPVRVKDRSGGEQHTIATFNMYVYLPHNFKGTHMSRFVEILNNHNGEITVESFQKMLPEMTEKLNADFGDIQMSFPYFVNKAAMRGAIRIGKRLRRFSRSDRVG